MLVDYYGEHAHGNTSCNGWFNMSSEERGRAPECLKTTNCKKCLMNMMFKRRNNSKKN